MILFWLIERAGIGGSTIMINMEEKLVIVHNHEDNFCCHSLTSHLSKKLCILSLSLSASELMLMFCDRELMIICSDGVVSISSNFYFPVALP
uniref:PPM-type phosphatase domain-containing protein n=1 Tax=Onchocerca volvulus TaxID=6282 RepID=A0A8R1TJS5_ONCVO